MGIVTNALLQENQEQIFDPSFNAPSYMRAADIHSIANRNLGRQEAESSIIEDVPKFIAASLVSGSAQLYNILPSIGNMLGGEFELAEIAEVMQSLDEDLGLYYQDHETSVDTVGFILSSLVPGLAGIKGLRAVQNAGVMRLESAMKTGRIGETTGKALGLLAPSRERHIRNAIQQLTTSNTPFKLTERNLLKSMASGFGQNVMEAAAFEIAVAATLHNSPVLENQDASDLASNIIYGGLAFGAIGGVVDATRGVFKIKGAVKDAAKEGMPWTHYEVPLEGASIEDRLATYWQQANDITAVPKNVSEARRAFLEQAGAKKQERLLQLSREELGKLAGGDQQLAEQMFTVMKFGNSEDALQNLFGLKSISKVADKDKTAAQVEKAKDRISKGKGTIVGKNGKRSDVEILENTDVVYTKVWGEEAGNIVTTKPIVTTLADSLKAGEKIDIDGNVVRVLKKNGSVDPVRNYKFSADARKPWSPLTATVEEANARHIWAQNLRSSLKDMPEFNKKQGGNDIALTPVVNESDLPMLEKMYREFEPGFMVKLETDELQRFSSKDEFFRFMVGAKERMANQLNAASNKGLFLSSADAVVARLRNITGINFAVIPGQNKFIAKQSTLGTKNVLGRPRSEAEKFVQLAISEHALTKYPLHRLVQALKHEEGHNIFDTLLDIGGIPANKVTEVTAELTKASKKIRADRWKHAKTDDETLKYLSRDHELMADTFAYFSQFPNRMAREAPEFESLFGHLVNPIPPQIVKQYMARAQKLTQEEIASMLNVRNSYLSGQMSKVAERDLFAMQSIAEEHTEQLVSAGIRKAEAGPVKLWEQPNYMRMVYDTTPVEGLDGNVLRGMAAIKERQRQYIAGTDRAVVSVLGADAAKLIEISDKDILRSNPLGSGGGFAAAASSNYGSTAAIMEYLGNATTGIIKKFQNETREAMEPALYKLAQNQKATIEWSTLNANLRAIPDQYVLDDTGEALIPRVLAEFNEAVASGGNPAAPVLRAADAPEIIPLVSEEVRELARIHIARNGKRVRSVRELKTAQGSQYTWNADVFYPTPVNPKDFPFFAQVHDESITGIGATKTIYANTPEQLEAMIAKLANEPTLVVRTKGETEKFFKAIDEFEYEHTMNENWIDTALYRNGASSPYFVPTDAGKITSDLLSWHTGAEASLVRGAVKVKYDKQFSELHALGDAYTNVATSRYNNSSLLKHSDDVVENPYAGYERTALGLKDYAKYPWWTNPNRQVDAAVSKMYNRITGVVEGSKTPAELDQINTILRESGYKGAAYDESMELLANHTAPKGALSSFVAKANALLASVVLRLDSLNAVNNAFGATVLRSTELLSVIRGINAANPEAVGELHKLAYIKTPGTGDMILSPTKLITQAVKNFGKKDNPMHQFYRDNGYMTTISDQYRQTLDNLTLAGKETVAELEGKIATVQNSLRKAADVGEKWTGNRLAEEFNRFVSADTMRQITDIAVKNNIITQKQQLAYINTFVNRVEGNYLAAQRPMMFQGPIGQAIGLFQTYQFNLMQQLLRHVGEGHAKDGMTLLGMQGTIYGMNGLPGFNAINTHIIGSASGNQQHKDLYDVSYGIAGKEAGDWLTYGVASNMLLHPDLKVNLYVRGDINPRHLTLVPTNPASVPIVQATGKFLLNLKRTADKLGQGGDVWTTLLQGLEHNGISRPLAGIAQTLEASANEMGASYSTSKRGNVIAANDFLSLANFARIIGGKPLDEAVAIDAAFRYKTYALKDAKQREILGAAIKSTMLAGNTPTTEQIEQFTQRYAELGGSQSEYNKWAMQLYRTANTSQANKISQDLNNPFNTSMQRLMGGYELRDFQ